MKNILYKTLAVVFALQIPASYIVWQADNPLPITEPVVVEMPKGGNITALAKNLQKEGIVKYPLWVRLVSRLHGYDRRLKAGEYQLVAGMSLMDVLDKVSSVKVVLHRLTLPEGLTTAQMLKLIANDDMLSGEITEPVKEGEMLPETYTFHKNASRDEVIRQAKSALQKALEKAWNGRAENLPLNSPDELLTLASIIEKETSVTSERGKIASVFINRLNKGMLLQTDPTVIYAITAGKSDLGRSLKRSDLSIDSPYNTYKYAGLPPTPICNAGLQALQAAAHPEDTPYLYFVASGDGDHNFATNLNEHNRNVQSWLAKIRQ